jgi:hypothetical protein
MEGNLVWVIDPTPGKLIIWVLGKPWVWVLYTRAYERLAYNYHVPSERIEVQ